MRRRASRQEWKQRVERWRDSGLTAKEYASEVGINANTLQNWAWRLARECRGRNRRAAKGRAPERPQRRAVHRSQEQSVVIPMVEVVNSTKASAVEEGFEVAWVNGITVRIPARFDETSLRSLLTVVGAL